MLKKVREQVLYRKALRSLVAPSRPDPGYYSRFGGLWTDRRDAGDEVDRRLADGSIDIDEAERLRGWIAHGYTILKQAVAPEVCDRIRADLDGAFVKGDERLLVHSPRQTDYEPLRAGSDPDRARVVDVYVHYDSAVQALFSDAIVRFLRTIFDDHPLLFQSLTFQRGSQQQLHQDSAFVVVSSPLEFAASWIALEDVKPGSGELMYLNGSHRLPEYLFSDKYKHWNAKRDGDAQHEEWQAGMQVNAKRMGLTEQTFLPRKGDALIWSADLAHGGSPVTDPELTRKSLVGHYCPDRVDPFYFKTDLARRGKRRVHGGGFASHHYAVAGSR